MTTIKRSNSKEVKRALFAYIIDTINSDVYDVETTTTTEKLIFLLDCFNKEFNYKENKIIYPNLQNRLSEWFMGLPSVFTVDFSNFDIINKGKEFCLLNDELTDRKIDAFIANWFNLIAFNVLDMCNKNKVDYSYLF